MRRLLLAALLLLAAVPCHARVAIIGQKNVLTGQGGGAIPDESIDRRPSLKVLSETVLAIMDKFGQPYDIIDPGVAKTEWCRTGVFSTSIGNVTYSSVIHLNYRGYLGINNPLFGYRPDSLILATASTTPLAVPQLFVIIDGDYGPSGARDSMGSTSNTGTDIMPPTRTRYLGSDPSIRFRTTIDESQSLKAAATPSGYLRMVLGSRINSFAVMGINSTSYGGATTLATNCVDCDSLIGSVPGFTAGADTGDVWVVRNDNTTNPKPIIGVDLCHFCGVEMDVTSLWAGMALLDSLTSGGVFDKSKLPLTIGLQVRGGWRRNLRSLAGGITQNDSANFKAVVDSLASLKVPFVVGVNIDSLADYPDEKNWWERARPYVHYAPEQWAGAVTTRRAANASWQLPYDPLGNARTRVLYGPDGTTTDTSIYMLLKGCYYKLDSTFNETRVDRVLMGANFRSIPVGLLAKTDSLMALFGDVGVKGFVTNTSWGLSAGNAASQSNPLSPSQLGGKLPIRWGRNSGDRITNWTTPSYVDSGSAYFNGNTYGVGQPGAYNSFRQIDAFWRGVISGRAGQFASVASGASADSTYWKMGSGTMRIFTIHAGDLGSGTRADADARPSRNGYWQIKTLANSIKAINTLAGRTIIKIEYPDRMVP